MNSLLGVHTTAVMITRESGLRGAAELYLTTPRTQAGTAPSLEAALLYSGQGGLFQNLSGGVCQSKLKGT